MESKTKKRIYQIIKIIWFIIGIFLALILLLVFIRTKTFSGSGVAGIGGAIGLAVLLAVSLISFFIFIGITLLFLLIKWIVKKYKKKRLNTKD